MSTLNPPSGTITFLFTDIEGSTLLAQAHPAEWEVFRQRHHTIVRAAVEAHQGHVFQVVGDAFCVAYVTAPDALAAAIEAQRALQAEVWGEMPIKVRMGIHTGAAEAHDGDYRGYLTLAQVQRVMSIACGNQTLVSNATAALVTGALPAGVMLRDLGVHRLKSLVNPERIYQVMAPDLPSDFPTLQSLSTIPNNLPLQLTSFIGREQEIAEVTRLLATTRLLTLTGVGGTGKTRLSLEVAAGLLDQFSDGVWLVELAPLADPAFVPQTVATALGVSEQPGRPILTTLTDYLRDKHMLLIVDNCEHLIEACARLSDTLLHAARDLKILASSREALAIAGETAFHVPSLPSPNPHESISATDLQHYAAVELFVERAAAVKPSFVLSSVNAPAVAQICHRLDGIPLAIELAAARIKVFGPEEIAARLDDRFRLLTGGSRTALPRQQTLRGAFDWSYSLLPEPERTLLRRLSVFAGGWTFEAAEAVCAGEGIDVADVLDLLARLLEKSLVQEEEKVGATRYRLLETVRQFAREKLIDAGELESVRRRHLAFYASLAAESRLSPADARYYRWLDQLDMERDNVRAAIECLLEQSDASVALRLAADLQQYWYQRYAREGLDYVSRILLMPEANVRSLERADALFCQGNIRNFQRDYAAALEPLLEGLAIANELNDQALSVRILRECGIASFAQRAYPSARRYLEEAVTRSNREGVPLIFLGDVVCAQGDSEKAKEIYEESVVWFRSRRGNQLALAYPLRRLALLAVQRGDHACARSFIRESLELNMNGGDMRGIAACLAGWAALAAAEGRTIDAARLGGAVHQVLDSLGTGMLPADHQQLDDTLGAVRAQLDAAAFAAAWAEGSAMTMEQAVAYTLNNSASW